MLEDMTVVIIIAGVNYAAITMIQNFTLRVIS